MKKNRFLALTMLCSAFCGMPTKAQEIKDSVPKKFVKNEKKLKVKGANSYSSGRPGVKKFEWNDFKKKFNDGVSGFVNLVIDHPIASFMIGGGLVLMEEGIRRKLHSKQETALVIYKPEIKAKFANEYVHSIFDSSLRHYVKEFLDDESVKNKILWEFFDLPFGSFDIFAYSRNELKIDREYYLKKSQNYDVRDWFKILGTSISMRKKYGGLKSSIDSLEEIGATFKFVTYMKEDELGIFYLCVDVIVGEKKMMTEEICYFNV